LNGVDGIIFVVDSRNKCLEHNLRSWNELKVMFGNDFYNIPIVISFNKYDIDESQKINEYDFLQKLNYNSFRQISINKTVATRGIGILDSFNKSINFLFPQLTFKTSMTN